VKKTPKEPSTEFILWKGILWKKSEMLDTTTAYTYTAATMEGFGASFSAGAFIVLDVLGSRF
jgi:hypothetical protein